MLLYVGINKRKHFPGLTIKSLNIKVGFQVHFTYIIEFPVLYF